MVTCPTGVLPNRYGPRQRKCRCQLCRTGMEKRNHPVSAAHLDDTRQIGPFPPVAAQAGKCQVAENRQPAVLARDDVLDLEGGGVRARG